MTVENSMNCLCVDCAIKNSLINFCYIYFLRKKFKEGTKLNRKE